MRTQFTDSANKRFFRMMGEEEIAKHDLGHAAQHGNIEEARKIIASCKRKRWDFSSAFTSALSAAACFNRTEMATDLLKAGAHAAGTNDSTRDYSPLDWAARKGNTVLITLLLDSKDPPDINDCGYDSKYSPLTAAADEGHLEAVKLLLDRGAEINPDHGGSPLVCAAREGHNKVVQELIRRGAEVNPKNDVSPLMVAAENGHLKTTRILLKHGANPNTYWRSGNYSTPLIRAMMHGHQKVVKLLVDHGANPHLQIHNNATAVTLARGTKRHDMLAIFGSPVRGRTNIVYESHGPSI